MRYMAVRQFLLAIAVSASLEGCGGSGDGSDGNARGASATMHNFTITEDFTLDDNLSGVWIEDSSIEFSAQFTEEYGGARNIGEASFRQTITIIEEDGELYIRNCDDIASNIQNGSTTLEFNLGISHYVLDKQSNTRMTGELDYVNEDDYVRAEGSGEVTLFKAGEGPASRDQLLDFSLGMLRYSMRSTTEKLIEIQCLSDEKGTYRVEQDGETTGPYQYDSLFIGTLFDDYVDFYSDVRRQYTMLHAGLDGSYTDMQADEAGEYINLTASGTNAITIEIDASTDSYYYDASSDSSSDAFTAKAELNF